MAIIPKVKCSNCDRSFSGLQSKCPYCGTRRAKGGKFSMPESGDPKWRLVVGLLLLVAVICTVIALVNINTGDKIANDPTASASASPSASGADSSPSASPSAASVLPSPSPSPSETLVNIESITIEWQFYNGNNEMTIDSGYEIQLEAVVYPASANVGSAIKWTSDNPGVCSVSSGGLLKGVGSGSATITATYNNVVGSLLVRVK